MQCAAVLLLELSYRTQHMKDPSADITSDIQKLIAWLHALGQNDPCADRAYWVLQRILQDVAPHFRSKADELLTQGLAGKDALELSSSSFASQQDIPITHNSLVMITKSKYFLGVNIRHTMTQVEEVREYSIHLGILS